MKKSPLAGGHCRNCFKPFENTKKMQKSRICSKTHSESDDDNSDSEGGDNVENNDKNTRQCVHHPGFIRKLRCWKRYNWTKYAHIHHSQLTLRGLSNNTCTEDSKFPVQYNWPKNAHIHHSK